MDSIKSSTTDGPQILVLGLAALASVAFILAVFFCCLQRCQTLFFDYQRLTVVESEDAFLNNEGGQRSEAKNEDVVHFEVVKPTLIYSTKKEAQGPNIKDHHRK